MMGSYYILHHLANRQRENTMNQQGNFRLNNLYVKPNIK